MRIFILTVLLSCGVNAQSQTIFRKVGTIVNVGIGTGTPFTGLTLSNTYGLGFEAHGNALSRRWWIGSDQTVFGDFALSTESSKGLATPDLIRLSIDAAGNVGVGVSQPINKLDVEGAVAIGSLFSGSSAAPAGGMIVQGGVGLGTATVEHQLDIRSLSQVRASVSSGNASVLSLFQASNSIGTLVQFGVSGSTAPSYGSLASGDGLIYSSGPLFIGSDGASGVIKFAAGASVPEIMRITASGVGIGTASPGAGLLLDVAGDARVGTLKVFQSAGLNTSYVTNGLFIGPSLVGITNTLFGSASRDFPSTLAGTSYDLPISVTGVTSNNCHVSLCVPWEAASGGGIFTHYESNDTVYVRFSNNQLTLAIDPTPAVFSVLVFKVQ